MYEFLAVCTIILVAGAVPLACAITIDQHEPTTTGKIVRILASTAWCVAVTVLAVSIIR
jgi:hypothetical protein